MSFLIIAALIIALIVCIFIIDALRTNIQGLELSNTGDRVVLLTKITKLEAYRDEAEQVCSVAADMMDNDTKLIAALEHELMNANMHIDACASRN